MRDAKEYSRTPYRYLYVQFVIQNFLVKMYSRNCGDIPKVGMYQYKTCEMFPYKLIKNKKEDVRLAEQRCVHVLKTNM